MAILMLVSSNLGTLPVLERSDIHMVSDGPENGTIVPKDSG